MLKQISLKKLFSAAIISSALSAVWAGDHELISFDAFLKEYRDPFIAAQKSLYTSKCYPFKPHIIEFNEDGEADKVYVCPKADKIGYFMRADGLKDLVIDGRGATVSLDSFNSFLIINNCENITVKNFNVTYGRIAFTQGTIVEVNAAKGYFLFSIDKGYPALPSDEWAKKMYGKDAWQFGSVMNRDSKMVKSAALSTIFIEKVEEAEQGLYKIFVKGGYKTPAEAVFKAGIALDDAFAMPVPTEYNKYFDEENPSDYSHMSIRSEGETKFPPAGLTTIAVSGSSNIVFENIRISRSRMMNFIAMGNEGAVTIRNCVVSYANPRDIISSWRDGALLVKNKVGPIIENCKFEGMLDDSLNFVARPSMIKRVVDDYHYEIAGSPVPKDAHIAVFYPDTGAYRNDIKVVSSENGVIGTDKPIPNVKTGTFRSFIDVGSTQIFNLDYINKGFAVRNCEFYTQRSRGVLIRCRDGVVENCRFANLGGSAVAVTNEVGGFFSGPLPQNVIVSNNKIGRTLGVPLYAGIATDGGKKVDFDSNIVFSGNEITKLSETPKYFIQIGNGKNYKIFDNEFIGADDEEVPAKDAVDIGKNAANVEFSK